MRYNLIPSIFFASVLIFSTARAEGPDPVEPSFPDGAPAVSCEVTQVIPENADFFAFGGVRPPVIGDRIEIDLSQKEIKELTFESGNAVPLARAGAKLSKSLGTSKTYSLFKGTHLGTFTQSQYTGVLAVSHLNGEGTGLLQVLRDQFGQFALHQLQMSCRVL